MKTYLAATEIIDRDHPAILELAQNIASKHDTIVTGMMIEEAKVYFQMCDRLQCKIRQAIKNHRYERNCS
ncbi:hypothetical protein QUB68_21300 [Microcoleus sp. A006_D1]|uniref:hypothetical protein n=1 Tax=Microcoleus sp. A006_D1 TaxID=3055267 RepID=UPI002FD48A4C